jgi:hypothetical protein
MSDQQAPPNGDTPAVAGPTEAPGTQEQPQVDWEKRYQDLQPEYTRTTQRLSELEQQQQWYELAMTTDDPDTHRQALQHLGYDVPDEEFEDAEPDGYEDQPVHDPRLDEVLAWKERQEQEAREAAGFEFLTGHINSEVERLGMDQLDDGTRQWILSRALASPGIPAPPGSAHDELPNVEAAYKEFQEWETERQKQWAKTKRAPHVPSGGLPANEAPNPGTGHDARMDRARRALLETEM